MHDIYININFLYILVKTMANTHWARHNQKIKEKIKRNNELKRPEQILKARKLLDQRRKRNGRKNKRSQRNNGKKH